MNAALLFILITGSLATEDKPQAEAHKPVASTSKSSAQGTCEKITGGTCAVLGCKAWRNAVCEDSKCICKAKDTCSFEGRCDTPDEMKRAELQEKALSALTHLQNVATLQKTAAARIEAQNDDALQSINDTKASEEANATAAACRENATKEDQALAGAKQSKVEADKEVTAATKASGQAGFGKAKDDQNQANVEVQKHTDAIYKAKKCGADEETKRDELAKKAAAEKTSSTICESDTGGGCNTLPCHAWRNAECIGQDWDIKSQTRADKKCLCPEGSCASEGMCVPSDSLNPLLPKNRTVLAKASFEKEIAADNATLKENKDATCVKNTGSACNFGFCVGFAWNTATCQEGFCVCKEESACVIQGVCAHKVTSADLGANFSDALKMASVKPSTLPLGFISFAALVSGVLISAGVIAFHQSNRGKKADYNQPLLD